MHFLPPSAPLKWLKRCCAVSIGVGLLVGFAIVAGEVHADDEAADFFESRVRPILIDHCCQCHGPDKQESGLRVDSRAALLQGGDGGAVVVPGATDASRLIQAVRHEGDLEMPPEQKLSAGEIASLEHWVKIGAPWPETSTPFPTSTASRAKNHWAFQPIRHVAVPQVAHAAWVRTPVDAFVLAKLAEAQLAPAPEADRRTLIRRACYTLTGLPPNPEEVEQFVHDDAPHAYENLIERLLASPQYGQQWARHWLDVARYSDTKGYVYAREERFWLHAWTYRDWVVEALNNDMPYNRFLLLQLAADQVSDCRREDLAAMGFLTLGRRFLGVTRDIIDDRIDVVTRGTLALTVSCARCHDHKYDPIPTADYYSLYGVFDSSAEQLVALDDAAARDDAFGREYLKRLEAFQSALATERAASAARARARVGDYLQAQTELAKYPAEGFDQIFTTDDLLPALVRQWDRYLHERHLPRDPVWFAWFDFASIPDGAEYADQRVAMARRIQEDAAKPQSPANRLIVQAFVTPPESFAEVVARYAKVLTDIDAQWQAEMSAAAAANQPAPTRLADPAADQIRQVLYGSGSPCEIPDEPMVHIESFFPTSVCEQLWKLRGEVDRWINASPEPPRFALTLVDRATPHEPCIFRRGNPLDKGDEVTRHFLSLLSPDGVKPFQHGSGRRELADAIIDPANPLTARVIVNRVWAHHFGRGLVTTPSDFGTRAAPPSHPELLDWLADRFVAEGWSLKQLHRWILLSATFRQTSGGNLDPQRVARAQRLDPDNRLLWRKSEQRLSFEEFRDSLLATSGELDPHLGGKPADLFTPPYSQRRTLYGLVDRQFLPATLRVFDFANPDLHIPQRSETTVPQQALFTMNHPLVIERARALAAAAQREESAATIAALFESVFQRKPSAVEAADALEFVRQADANPPPPPRLTAADWQYGFGAFDEAAQRVADFTSLPHFTGSAWQGGPHWPDAKLGWVQLTAAGGHPGNDRSHACIRRWTAPRPMRIRIESKLVQDAAPGDGIRAFLVSSHAGLLQTVKVHQTSAEVSVSTREVAAGETIDFVVDIGDVLHSDQFLWTAEIHDTTAADATPAWNSRDDFPADSVDRLTAWEQLAQVLLCTNEFLFVD